MLRLLLLLVSAVALSACQQAEDSETPAVETGVVSAPAPVAAKEAYEQACAGCHEEGKDDAPRTGDPDAWAGRSSLWEAVLFEHAQDGYLDMPAHGTDGRFSDDTVALAAQYMLEITHPDRPRD